MLTDSDGNGARESTDGDAAKADSAGRAEATGGDEYGELKSAISSERKARKTAETALGELQKRLADLEAKDQTDLEKAQTERDRLKSELEARDARLSAMATRTALLNAATKAGARYPDLLVDRLASSAELDADLVVTNADTLVNQARKDYPDLFTVVSGKSDGGRRADEERTIRPGFDRLANAYAKSSPERR